MSVAHFDAFNDVALRATATARPSEDLAPSRVSKPLPGTVGSIRFDAVQKTYISSAGAVRALSDISVDVPAGSVFGIIGRSGAGKSSLLRLINRLERPSGGQVLVDGEDISTFDEDQLVALRRRIGMIFQHFNLLSAKTVFGNVALPLVVAGVPAQEVRERVAEVLKLVGLEGKENTFPSRLSGGQKQRVGIARALVSRPEILLCDEATSALDPETTLSILSLLKDINRRLGLTIVLITHEMSVIREICDHVLVLEAGEIAETGPVWQVFGNPCHEATLALLKPLDRGLPEEVTERLASSWSGQRATALIEFTYKGTDGLQPDLSRLLRVLGEGTHIIQSNLDRIQGHVSGRLVVASPARADLEHLIKSPDLAHAARIIGYDTADV